MIWKHGYLSDEMTPSSDMNLHGFLIAWSDPKDYRAMGLFFWMYS